MMGMVHLSPGRWAFLWRYTTCRVERKDEDEEEEEEEEEEDEVRRVRFWFSLRGAGAGG
jgi:hypothetical protein